MSAAPLIETVTPDSLTSLLQDVGCRVNRTEQNGVIQLLTATQGVGYAVRLGNQSSTQGQYLDFTYSCAMRIQGELPESLVNQWNASRRFARLSVQGEFLVLEKDVIVADGISAQRLLGSFVLWDRLLQEFVIYLRNFAQNNTTTESVEAVSA